VFYHPTDLYSFRLAKDWQTAITPASLSIGSEDGEAILSFMVEEDTMTFKHYLDSFEKAMLEQSRVKPSIKEYFEWYGHQGEVIEYTSNSNDQVVKFKLIAVDYGKGKVFKIAALYAESSEKKVNGLWIAEQVSMEDHKKNHKTTLSMTNFKINQGLSDDEFTLEKLVPAQ